MTEIDGTLTDFDEAIETLALNVEDAEGTVLAIAVCDHEPLRQQAIARLRQRLAPDVELRDFQFGPDRLSLLEGAAGVAAPPGRRWAVSVTGLETLELDKRTEAIKLLNQQRNRLGRASVAAVVWVDRPTHSDLSRLAADFYSWRSATVFVEPPPGWLTLDRERRRYLEALIRQNELVNLQGLAPTRGGQIVQMRMEDIFVPLHVEPAAATWQWWLDLMAREDPRGVSTVARLLGTGNAAAIPPVVADFPAALNIMSTADLMKLPPETRELAERFVQDRGGAAGSRRLRLADLTHVRRAVVLGDPGAGKTTLLRYLAFTVARAQLQASAEPLADFDPDFAGALPVYLRLGEYAQHLRQDPSMTIGRFALLAAEVQRLPLSQVLLDEAFAAGRLVLLLDGLDEIIDPEARRLVADRVCAAAREHPNARFVVTSRVVGYREAPLAEGFEAFTIAPFEDEDIRRFAHAWYTALGIGTDADGLVQTIAATPAVRRLASNPLLLTVIALIHWRGTKLPRHRVKLYSQAAETLTDQWMSHRRVSPEGWNVQETLNLLLPTIAYHLHGTASSGVIGEEDLHRLLVQTLLQHEPGLGQADADSRAATFRRNVSEFSGIFLERGRDRTGRGLYGFLHLTFQEYFAARCLVEHWQREGDDLLRPLLHDPRWIEVILLSAGHLGEFSSFQATRFVAAILGASSPWEPFLHRDLMLAARSLADDVAVDATLRRDVVSRLVELYFSSDAPDSLKDDVADVLGQLGGAAAEKDAIDLLSHRNPSAAVARVLGRIAESGSTSAVVALRKLLSSDEEATAVAAVAALAKVGQLASSPEFPPFLLRMAEMSDSSGRAVSLTFSTLGGAAATPSILSSLRRLLAGPSETGRKAAIQCLGNIVDASTDRKTIANDSEMVEAVAKCLADEAWPVRAFAVMVLVLLETPSAFSHLLESMPRLLADSDSTVRVVALYVLGKLGEPIATPAVVQMVVDRLGDVDAEVAAEAAPTLAALGPSARSNEVLFRLLDEVRRAGPSFRASAQAVARLAEASGSIEIVRLLLDLFSHERAGVRAEVLLALGAGERTAARAEVIAAAVAGLADQAAEVRAAAATTLGKLEDKDAAVSVAGPLRQALSDEDARVRAAAAAALGAKKLVETDPSIRGALLERLEDPDPGVRRVAVESIARCGPVGADTAVAQAVTLRLDDPDKAVRPAAAEALRALGSPAATPATLEALATRLRSADSEVAKAGEALKHLSTAVVVSDRPRALSLFASLAQSPEPLPRDVGYVGLRNLLATGAIAGGDELVSPPRRLDRPALSRRAARPSRRPR